MRHGGENGLANGTLAVQELMAATDGAYAALWRYLFGVDLVGTVQARLRRSGAADRAFRLRSRA